MKDALTLTHGPTLPHRRQRKCPSPRRAGGPQGGQQLTAATHSTACVPL